MLELLDYRRRVFALYHAVRVGAIDAAGWRQGRDELFLTHSQSALDATQKAAFAGLRYYPYNPAYRVLAAVDYAVESAYFEFDLGADGAFRMRRFGAVDFVLPTGVGRLSLFWIEGYGGGVFLPFGDTTNRQQTYGGGRYLLDTIKGADLGMEGANMVLDFNYAYHPSCAYNPRWTCPLSPPENRLDFPVMAGEQL